MDNPWTVFVKQAQNISSHWTSYTVLGSFVLYVFGYLTLRFHLTALGVGTDLAVIDERYLFTGTRFLIYIISSVPNLLMLILLLVAPVYLPYRILPSSFRLKIGNFIYRQWQRLLSWWLVPNRLALLGIVLSLLMIQLVMRQCFLFSNMLLADSLPNAPIWLWQLLVSPTDKEMALYFSGILGGAITCSSIFYKLSHQQLSHNTVVLKRVLGFLVSVQLLFIPVNYGVLVLDKSMPRVTGLEILTTLNRDEQAWLVWEGKETKTFLLRKKQAGSYKKSLISFPKNNVKKIEISGYDRIFYFLFEKTLKR